MAHDVVDTVAMYLTSLVACVLTDETIILQFAIAACKYTEDSGRYRVDVCACTRERSRNIDMHRE